MSFGDDDDDDYDDNNVIQLIYTTDVKLRYTYLWYEKF